MSRTLLKKTAGIAATLAVLSSCDGGPMVCSGTGRHAITARVRDATTGQPAAYQAMLTARVGSSVEVFTDRTPAADSALALELMAGLDIPGVYSVTIEKGGYRSWTRDEILVRPGESECASIHGVILDVGLERLDNVSTAR